MPARRIPTYAEIASFRESLIKTRKQLELDELEKLHGTLVRMEFDCLRAIPSLATARIRTSWSAPASAPTSNTGSSIRTSSSVAISRWPERHPVHPPPRRQ